MVNDCAIGHNQDKLQRIIHVLCLFWIHKKTSKEIKQFFL